MSRPNPFELLLDRVERIPFSGCWIWNGGLSEKGYGVVRIGGKHRKAHRVFYSQLKGMISPGLEVDHLCRVRCCVNPDHLEAVTHKINVMRGECLPTLFSKQTHCVNGHQYTQDNVRLTPTHGTKYIWRQCVKCCKHAFRKERKLAKILSAMLSAVDEVPKP